MTCELPETWTWRHEPLIGTVVEIRVAGTCEPAAQRIQRRVVAEMVRLEQVFSVFDESSELRRWSRGEEPDAALDPELTDLLRVAAHWHRRSGGAFHPAAGALMALWRRAEQEGIEPRPAAVEEAVAAGRVLPFAVTGDGVSRRGNCAGVDLNAIAKGRIVDQAVAAGGAGDADESVRDSAAGVSLLVNAGGDLRHRGPGTIRVGIEDPRRPHDNVAPMLVVEIGDQALATSGAARRGFRIRGRWYGHVLDPRRGVPVDGVLSASVIAPDATTADVVATVVGVIEPRAALDFVSELDGVGCCLLDRDGMLWRDEYWLDHQRPRPTEVSGW